jgi:phosphoglycolate phosphatase
MTRLAVFDLDGTLVDSAPDIHAAGNAVLAEWGRGPVTAVQARRFIGHGAGVFVARLRAAQGIDGGPEDAARMVDRFVEIYETAHERTTLYPGAVAALERLAAAGLRLGLCTNKPERPARALLAHLGLTQMFGAVVGGDTLAVRKPDPAPLAATVAALGGGAALYVGDSEVDADSALRAGLPFALFTEGYRQAEVDALPHRWAFDRHAALPGIAAEAFARG